MSHGPLSSSVSSVLGPPVPVVAFVALTAVVDPLVEKPVLALTEAGAPPLPDVALSTKFAHPPALARQTGMSKKARGMRSRYEEIEETIRALPERILDCKPIGLLDAGWNRGELRPSR
jgi:hypothetical protein